MADPLECFAVAAPGIEPITAREVALPGVAEVATEPGGAPFRASLAAIEVAPVIPGA